MLLALTFTFALTVTVPYNTLWLLYGIFVQNVFETNLIFRYQRVKNQKKNKDTDFISTFKIDITRVPLFFSDFFTRWYLKLRFVSNNFWTKIPKSSHSDNSSTAACCSLHRCIPLHTSSEYSYELRYSAAVSQCTNCT